MKTHDELIRKVPYANILLLEYTEAEILAMSPVEREDIASDIAAEVEQRKIEKYETEHFGNEETDMNL